MVLRSSGYISNLKENIPIWVLLSASFLVTPDVRRGERTESLGKWYPVWARLGFALMISAVGMPSALGLGMGTSHRWGPVKVPEVMIPAWRLYLIKRSLETWSVGDSCSYLLVSSHTFSYLLVSSRILEWLCSTLPNRCQRPMTFIILYWIYENLDATWISPFKKHAISFVTWDHLVANRKIWYWPRRNSGHFFVLRFDKEKHVQCKKKNKESASGGTNRCDLTAF